MELKMKTLIKLLICTSYIFISSISGNTLVFSECYDDAESGFYQVIDTKGWEEGVCSLLRSINPICYEPFFKRHQDKTEPVIREIILHNEKYDELCISRAIFMSSQLKLSNLVNEYQKLASHPIRIVMTTAKREYAKTCEPGQFSELLKMITPEEPDLNRGLLAIMRERKIFDPSLLKKWRDEQIEKDKHREKTMMREWFLKEVNQTIEVLRNAQPQH